mgnify:CR=1 FL=1
MTWVTIGLSAGTLVGMAIVLTSVLGWAKKKFHVDVDERVLAVIDELPGANCGGCGYVGCGEYAEAVVLEQEDLSLIHISEPTRPPVASRMPSSA